MRYNRSMDIKRDGSVEFDDHASQIQNTGLALKVFKEQCCDSCTCKSE